MEVFVEVVFSEVEREVLELVEVLVAAVELEVVVPVRVVCASAAGDSTSAGAALKRRPQASEAAKPR